MKIPYESWSGTCFSTKQPKPDKFVVTEGIPITVHSAKIFSHTSVSMKSLNTGRITPWLIVRWKYSQVTATNKVLIVQTDQWRDGTQKLGVENNLNFLKYFFYYKKYIFNVSSKIKVVFLKSNKTFIFGAVGNNC